MGSRSTSGVRVWGIALVGAVLLSGVARAATIEATFSGVDPKKTLTYWLQGVGQEKTQAGAFNWLRTGGDWPNPPPVNSTFITFCIELIQSVQPNQNYTYEVAQLATAPLPYDAPLNGPMGAVKAGYIEELWAARVGTLVTDNDYAAMQTAVWELVYDTDLTLTTGTFQAVTVAPFVTLAQTFLDALTGTPPTNLDLRAMTSLEQQDQTFLTVIPAPPAALGGLASLLLGTIRRR